MKREVRTRFGSTFPPRLDSSLGIKKIVALSFSSLLQSSPFPSSFLSHSLRGSLLILCARQYFSLRLFFTLETLAIHLSTVAWNNVAFIDTGATKFRDPSIAIVKTIETLSRNKFLRVQRLQALRISRDLSNFDIQL